MRLVDIHGEPIPKDNLRSELAAQFVRYVDRAENASFDLVDCYSLDGVDAVHVLVRADVPQRKIYDIRREEPLLITFDEELPYLTDVLALRADFPMVPHLNLKRERVPKSLCLYGDPSDEVRMRWTPALLGERILLWLQETARGTLHRSDQGLEPFVAGHVRPIIVPPDIFQDHEEEVLTVRFVDSGAPTETMIAVRPSPGENTTGTFTLIPFQLPTQVHGVIALEPRTLSEFHQLCLDADFDLLGALRTRLQSTAIAPQSDSNGTIVVLAIPKSRQPGGPIEAVDWRGFRCGSRAGTILQDVGPGRLGVALGLLERSGKAYVPMLISQALVETQAIAVGVSMLHPLVATSREDAARMSGLAERDDRQILAIGMGALGSQVFANLARQGYGQWTIIDEDRILPHNMVRHAVLGGLQGRSKAAAMAEAANGLFYGPSQAAAIVCDIMNPGAMRDGIRQAAEHCAAIIDFSASVPVARHIALNLESCAPRASLFLTPDGSDLVMLCEDASRTSRLDSLEAQYLRAVLQDSRLEGHLSGAAERMRYGASCRDVSSTITQELVGLHAAIGARALRTSLADEHAQISVWRASPAMEVRKVNITPHAALVLDGFGWTIILDEGLRAQMVDMRRPKLPRETCGILIGSFDTLRKHVYVVDALPPTADTVEEASGCLRGTEGLTEILACAVERSHGQVDYIGEWHSHPDDVECLPSPNDSQQMVWVANKMHPEGKPGLILIICQDGTLSVFLTEPH